MSDSVGVLSKEIPASNKYDAINLDKIRGRTLVTTIHKTNSPRFKPTVKTLEPSPTSYNTLDPAIKSKFAETTLKFNRTKKVSYFDV